MASPLDSLSRRLAAVEARQRADVDIDRLPLSAIRQAVLLDQPMDPTELILPHSITDDHLADEAKQLFPQLVTAGEIKVSYGTSFFDFTADSTITTAVAHSLGNDPVWAGAFPERTANGININISVGWDSTNVTYQGTTITGAAITDAVDFWWLAVG
jgi:hypothetical protein